jgi:hypothetical protein
VNIRLTDFLSLLEPLTLAVLLWVVGRLSRRMGEASHAKPRYGVFFAGAALAALGALARAINLIFGLADAEQIAGDILWVLLYNGLPAAAVTLGLLGAWHYWSWLLAERS